MRINDLWSPFGKEYARAPQWGPLERCYIGTFGMVDLPSRLRARVVIREALKFKKEDVLDLGSGTGCYSFYFSRWPSTRVWGIDINESRIGDCEQISKQLKRNNLKFCTGDGHLGLQMFDSTCFDQVLLIEALQCFPNSRLALSEIHRILRPGGILIGHVPVLGYLREFEKTLFDDSTLKNLLREAGFEIMLFTPTFGGKIQKLCEIFNRACRFRPLTASMFPLLLLVSGAFRIESPDGSYRLFVARKPILFQ